MRTFAFNTSALSSSTMKSDVVSPVKATSGDVVVYNSSPADVVMCQLDINYLVKCTFSFLRFGQFYDFRPKVCFSASGSKRFKILPFSSGSLTQSIFPVKSGVFSSFLLT
ncbi:hypothetical protein Hanom_Chr09g00839301 [Helianthus anomalus]